MIPRPIVLLLTLAGVALTLLPATASATSTIDGVSCVTLSNCVAVGSSDVSGGTRAQVFSWNGTAWVASTTPSPAESTQGQLFAVSCRSASDCMAVGKHVDASDIDRPLAMRWNGKTWAVTSLPMPSGAAFGELAGVSCPAFSSKCKAVGSYFDSSGTKQPLALRWDGSKWEIDAMPLPSGATSGEGSAVMCKTETFCQATGSYVTSAGETMPFADRWNGSVWAGNSVPVPSGATYGSLSGVSCYSTTFCTGVGTFVTSSGVKQALDVNWNGTSWSSSTIPFPSGATSSALSGVSCVAANACSAVGEYQVGSDTFPLAVWWNGASWSQQPIDTETYGAVATVLRSVSCLSSTACHATGSITYGHAATPRQLAYRYDGTAWVLTESGNYQRTWSAFAELGDSVQDVTDSRTGVSCSSASFCVRVGSFTHGGVESSRARVWNGSSWSTPSLPSPSGAVETALRGVKCVSATDCRAVGSYVDSAGVRKTLALAWNGTAWSVATTPNPSGATSSELSSIACTSTTFCRAVGSYVDSAGVRKTLALAWNGTAWSVATTPNPSGATSSELSSVACTSTTFCFAVGDFANSAGETKTQAMKFDGSSWSSLATTNLSGVTENELFGVYCSSTSACLAVGRYGSASASGALTLTFQLSGSTWSSTAGKSAEPAGASASSLYEISCTAATACVAVGEVVMGEKAPTELAESFNGTSWTKTDPQKVVASWNGVSCRSVDPCVAVGSSTVGGNQTQRAKTLTGSGWENMELPALSQAKLLDVSCTGTSECTAVGSQGSPSLALAERWNGSQWSTQTTPTPSGGSSVVLNSVSCVSATLCMAVGSFANGTSPLNPLVEKWNGSSWAIEALPAPPGATQVWLEGVSCSSTTQCVAVGGYQDASGVRRGLIERWSGTSWAIQTPPQPSGATRVDLNGVSCKSTVCTAVGAYWNSSGRFTHVLRWNGTAWTIQPSPNPETSSTNTLTDVSCFTSTKCVASGVAEPTSTAPDPYPIAMGWDGTTWSLETIPVPEWAKSGSLYDISCTSTADCVASGTASAGLGEDSEGFSVGSIEPEAPSAEATAIPLGEEFSLTSEQEADAISILSGNPEFQAAIGGADFTAEVIPWLETTSGGTDVLIGAVVDITLTESRSSWGQWWNWPAADYGPFYESGTYLAETVQASASSVDELSANLDAVLDSAGQFLDGEMVQLQPLPDENGTVTLAPSAKQESSGA
jgi:hypothetical protein